MSGIVGHLIPTVGPYNGLASDRTVVGEPIPVFANADGYLMIKVDMEHPARYDGYRCADCGGRISLQQVTAEKARWVHEVAS